uniref:Ubiquitin thioesterase OTU n=1 Tax=Lygus hesperus TaxID=30085 RepID=A0A0A9Z5Y8_LYGHE
MSGIDMSKLRVLHSYPPKPIETSTDTLVKDLHLRQNDTLIVQEGEANVQMVNTGKKYVKPSGDVAHLVRRICPGDNSCLFHACAYILRDKSRIDGPALRRECVNTILTHPEKYNVETIGQDTTEYAK